MHDEIPEPMICQIPKFLADVQARTGSLLIIEPLQERVPINEGIGGVRLTRYVSPGDSLAVDRLVKLVAFALLTSHRKIDHREVARFLRQLMEEWRVGQLHRGERDNRDSTSINPASTKVLA